MTKHEWRKKEKHLYLPSASPQRIDVPAFGFFVVSGAGNPNDAAFSEYVSVLYALAYAVRMSPKKGLAPTGYFPYTVYPLEGIWDLHDAARANYDGTLRKADLVFSVMIRQPDFVDAAYAQKIMEHTAQHKPHPLFDEVVFETIREGLCVQMMHIGPYDREPESFAQMETYAEQENMNRTTRSHREIYISDPRKTAPDKRRTVLRFPVEPN